MRLLLLLLPLLAPAARSQSLCSDMILYPSDGQAGDNFGFSFEGSAVAMDGPFAIVGAPSDDDQGDISGSAYILERVGGEWSIVQKLTASDGGFWRGFGTAVDLRGTRAVVGSPGPSCCTNDGGAAHVFELQGGTWVETAALRASDLSADHSFGSSVAIDGDRVLIGDPDWRVLVPGGGAAYVFELGGSGWLESARIEAPMVEGADRFGSAVELVGDALYIATPFDRASDGFRRGAVYVYGLNGSSWDLQQKLEPPLPHEFFGHEVCVSGTWLGISGSRGSGFDNGPGTVFLYQDAGGTWSSSGMLEMGVDHDRFGQSFDIEGDRMAVGVAGMFDVPSGVGAVQLYEQDAGTWEEAGLWQSTDSALAFGNSVGISGDSVIAGDRAGPLMNPGGSVTALPFAMNLTSEFCYCTSTGCQNIDTDAGCQNAATGSGCRLSACGSTSLALDDLVLTATNTGPDAFGLMFMGRTATALQFFGNGRRCVDDPVSILRFPIRNGGSSGVITEGPGIGLLSTTSFPAFGQILAGDTWHFQLWYRDTGGCQLGYNASNAVSATFAP